MKEGEDFEFKQHLKLFNQTISGQFIKCTTARIYKRIEIIITKLIVQLWDMIIKILLKSMWNRCQLCTKVVSSVGVGRTRSIFFKLIAWNANSICVLQCGHHEACWKYTKWWRIFWSWKDYIQTDWKVAKDLATKAATKANEKSAENVGSKTGQLIGVKFVTNLTLAREKKFMTLPKR